MRLQWQRHVPRCPAKYHSVCNKKEGWLSPTERASVSAISLKPRLHVSRQYVAWTSNMLPATSNMLPGNISLVAGNMLPVSRQHVSLCIQQQTGNKLATILLPVWQHVACCGQHVAWSNMLLPQHLATSRESKAHFGLPWVRPWDNRGKCYMDGKRIQCLSNASQHAPIYLQPFTSNSEILVGNCNFFLPLAFNAPVGVFPLEFRGKVWSS